MDNKSIIILKYFFFCLNFWTVSAQSNIITKEIKIKYQDGFEVFSICQSNCDIIFDNSKEYFWYTEFSKLKSTKGGSGGELLHGAYKFYDESGNLREQNNFYKGLKNGSQKQWDEKGQIINEFKYDMDEIVYMKLISEDGIVEHIGAMFKEGWVKKSYTKYNILVAEEIQREDFNTHTKIYFENGNIKEEFTGMGNEFLTGPYRVYYENGILKIKGQFYDGFSPSLKTGTWEWYTNSGRLDYSIEFKPEVDYWQNGKLKISGNYLWDSETNQWLKTGEWNMYNEEGTQIDIKKYEFGKLVD